MNQDETAPSATGPCDHDWEWKDDSFDHEYGTERIHFWQCKHCDATKPAESEGYNDPDRP